MELYSRDILRLASRLAPYQPVDGAQRITKVSRLCGSRLTLEAKLDDAGRIAAFSQEVRACALGQAAAALVADSAVGLTRPRFDQLDADFRRMVQTGEADFTPEFSVFAALSAVSDFPGRHGSVLLPFDCLKAIFSTVEARECTG